MHLRLIGTVLLFTAAAAAAAHAKPRNVVVFVADDLGWRDLGYSGSTFYESPNVDALAKRGMAFDNAYAACPVCSPTRAALLTGRYPARTGITDWIGAAQPEEAAKAARWKDKPMLPAAYREQLPHEEVTLGEAFRDAGYATAFLGKWHLGGPKYYPTTHGFDVGIGATHRGSPGPGGYFPPYKVDLPGGEPGEHLDLRLANEAARWIDGRDKSKPFLLYFSLYDVHTPLMAPPEAVKHFEAKRQAMGLADAFGDEGESKVRLTQSHAVYAAMVKTMDDAVGTVVKKLETDGLLDSTVIVFTSDNGGLSTKEGSPTSNLPLRAGKGWPYEGGVRVPMIVVAPGLTKPGSATAVPTVSTDLFPTLLAACGLAPREKDHVDGVDLTPALRGESLPGRPLFWHYPHYGNQGGSPYSAVRSGDWKLIAFHDPEQAVELYDLSTDPEEKRNLATRETDKVKQLRTSLTDWKQSVGAKDATSNPNAKPAASASADLPGTSKLILTATDKYPRYSEGDVIELKDGRLLLSVGRKAGASDFAAGTIVGMFSKDGGRTWDGEPHVIKAPWGDMVDLMSTSFVRTPRGVHLFFLGRGKDAKGDTRPYQMLSTDEGKTWSDPQLVARRTGYHVVNNARVIRTGKGRLLVPAAYVERIDKDYDGQSVLVLYSDDDGVTWTESNVLRSDGKPLMEPGVAECADGSIYMTIRTATGVLYEARSRDGGATWADLAPTSLPSPAAPSTVVRAPGSDELWLFWCNNAKAKWKHRTPQVFARSTDHGKTWSAPRVIEHAPKHGYGYISFTRVKDDALLTYYDWEDKGQRDFSMTNLRQRTIPLAWLRGRAEPR